MMTPLLILLSIAGIAAMPAVRADPIFKNALSVDDPLAIDWNTAAQETSQCLPNCEPNPHSWEDKCSWRTRGPLADQGVGPCTACHQCKPSPPPPPNPPPPAPPPPPFPPPATQYQIKNRHGICLDSDQMWNAGGRVHLWECQTFNTNQQWVYNPHNGQIKSKVGTKCLDASGRGDENPGGKIHMWHCETNNDNQKWHYEAGSGLVKTVSYKHRKWNWGWKEWWTTRCLDAPHRNSNGEKVHLWDCDAGAWNQQWTIG